MAQEGLLLKNLTPQLFPEVGVELDVRNKVEDNTLLDSTLRFGILTGLNFYRLKPGEGQSFEMFLGDFDLGNDLLSEFIYRRRAAPPGGENLIPPIRVPIRGDFDLRNNWERI